MEMRLALLLCSLPFIFLPACREAPSSGASVHLYADYYVRYLASTRELKAEARFMEGDDLQTADGKTVEGGVFFLENPMQLEAPDDKAPRYTWSGVRPFPSELHFRRDGENSGDLQEMTMQPIRQYAVRTPFQKGESLSVTAGGSLLRGNESLVLLLADVRNRAASYTIEGPASDSTHHIPPEAFSALMPGPATVYLVKRMRKTIAQPHHTTTATIEYYTDTLRVLLVE